MTPPNIREAVDEDFESVRVLYRQLQPNDPILTSGQDRAVFRQILAASNLHLFVAGTQNDLTGSIYLNVIPNMTRSASPYAVIENVITREDKREQGIGHSLMRHCLDFAWRKGCYKAMLQTGSKRAATHAFYLSCGFSNDEKVGYLARPG